MVIEHFISDADGVIVDSKEMAWANAHKIVKLFKNVESFRTTVDYKRHFGREAQELLVGKNEAETLRALHRLLMRYSASQIKCFENILDIVSRIKIKKTIVTSAFASGIREILKENINLFDEIIGRESGRKSNILERIIRGNEIYLTDSCRDIKTCQEMNLRVIGVGWGYEIAEEIIKANPDYFVKSPIELNSLLKKLDIVE